MHATLLPVCVQYFCECPLPRLPVGLHERLARNAGQYATALNGCCECNRPAIRNHQRQLYCVITTASNTRPQLGCSTAVASAVMCQTYLQYMRIEYGVQGSFQTRCP